MAGHEMNGRDEFVSSEVGSSSGAGGKDPSGHSAPSLNTSSSSSSNPSKDDDVSFLSPPSERKSKPETEVSNDLQRVAKLIKSGKAKDIILLLGAGISTSAGIPDFRSPNTGLYDNLQALNLPFPEAVFELGYFRQRPEPFWTLAKELYPGKHFPTPTHYFLTLLHDHSTLKRIYTQNIDTLETLAGVSTDKIIEAHGSFASSHCLDCGNEASREYVLASGVREGKVVRCSAASTKGKEKKKKKEKEKETCGGLVKPDIVFFGEGLPDRFFNHLPDFRTCDLLIVIGTSLQVQPFASLVDRVPSSCPRLLINREAVGPFARIARNTRSASLKQGGRDMFWQGDADDGVYLLAQELDWKDELDKMILDGRQHLTRVWKSTQGAGASTAKKRDKDVDEKIRREEEVDAGTASKNEDQERGGEAEAEADDLEQAIRRQLKL